MLLATFSLRAEDEWERAPISYSEAKPANAVERLADALSSDEKSLAHDPKFGYLPALLDALAVKPSSQTLVFSKTSLQRSRISPKSPRALYFSDDVYVGYCQNGEVLEISAVDPQLGAVFYTLDQHNADKAVISRQTDNCLLCHGGSRTGGIPGHVLRSIYPSNSGEPVLALGSHRVDHTTSFADRWGGWYVTGTHGQQTHLGNMIVRDRETRREALDNAAGQNVIDLSERFKVDRYVAPHSDLVALMVLEHQAEGHNRITRASFETRMALHREKELNRELKEPPDHRWESTNRCIQSASESLVEYLFFVDEAKLAAPIAGTSSFATDYASAGPRDSKGRSLRDLDLQKRLLKYPLSPLIYTEAFDALPDESKQYVYRRIREVLSDEKADKRFAHLSVEDRAAIGEILSGTKPEFVASPGQPK